jgi:alginate O-acetyltransferase complex protein AlgJ
MLLPYGRFWLIFVAGLLVTPAFVHLSTSGKNVSLEEGRLLASLPGIPKSRGEAKNWFTRLDAYLGDHFGFRDPVIRIHTWINQATFSETGNASVFRGADGWMVYRGNSMLEQSSGQIIRKAEIEHTVNVLAGMEALLSARGSKLIVASPPNSATIYSDKIPGWPRSGKHTEYDLQLSLLRSRNINAVDLRPVLREARSHGDTYLHHDSHWNAIGALAAFNAITAEAGLEGWHLDPATAIGPATSIRGGDLARMLGIADYVGEVDHPLKLGGFERVDYSTTLPVYELANRERSGPVIMVLGDSFTMADFAPMIAASGGRAIWLHHNFCGFDWQWIEKLRPDQVWYMPTERYLPCDLRKHPIGMSTRLPIR